VYDIVGNTICADLIDYCVFRSKGATLSEQTGRPFGVK